MSGKILEARLEMLKSSLQEVQLVTETIKVQRANLEGLLILRKATGDLVFKVGQAVGALDANRPDAAIQVLESIRSDYVALTAALLASAPAAESISKNLKSLPMNADFMRVLSADLVDLAQTQHESITAIDDALGAPAPGQDVAMQAAWSAYTVAVNVIQRVFTEYVDFLGGWALRNAGFDQGVCGLADELISGLHMTTSLLPTLPARQAALDKTLARIVRLGFPGWSFWALPLTAHELGHIVLQRAEADERTPDQVYLADAFATRAMGPAYVCAEIYLRLDPRTSEGWKNTTRVQVMLAMLKLMDADSRAGGEPFGAIRQHLQQEWDDAVQQSQATDDRAADDELDGWMGQVKEKISRSFSLGSADWSTIEAWSRKLSEGRVDEIIDEIDADAMKAELRYVLNAAWHCRVMTSTPQDDLSTAGYRLWDKVVEKRHDTSTAGGRGSSSPSSGRRP